MDYVKIGERVRKNRLSKNMTQEQLAEKINRSVHYISQIEHSKRKPSLETIVNIANALDIPVDSIVQDSLSISASPEMMEIEKILSGKTPAQLNAIIDILKVIVLYIKP